LHGEIDAIIKIPYGSKPFSIYVARVTPSGKIKLAKPCPICSKALQDIGIKNIYYTT
jgi:tRNA(Arg) A34 adenosine deaminase TadA